MPVAFVIALVAIVLLLAVVRLTVPSLPLRPIAVSPTRWEAVAVLVGLVGLLLHCTAMFNRAVLAVVPGSSTYISAVNAMAAPSVLLYVVPAVLVLLGLRCQHRVAVTVLTAALLAVGVTMYDHGPVTVHLTAIFLSAVLLAATLALLVGRPRDPHRSGTSAR